MMGSFSRVWASYRGTLFIISLVHATRELFFEVKGACNNFELAEGDNRKEGRKAWAC
jgi:hypothetical protein